MSSRATVEESKQAESGMLKMEATNNGEDNTSMRAARCCAQHTSLGMGASSGMGSASTQPTAVYLSCSL